MQGALTRIGDTLDRLTGRRWKPSSSLATSGLIERMKMLLDSEIKQDAEGRNFVPHNIKLKMQWDKFSTDSEDGLKKLEHELLTAAVDHISDNRYHTYAPLKLEVKPDYFTQGVKLFVSFEKFDEERGERELNVTVPAASVADLIPEGVSIDALAQPIAKAPDQGGELIARFTANGVPVEKRFEMKHGNRLSIGRTKNNDIAIDHTTVSKMHASLLLSADTKLVVADTGSTNGTYLNGERIAYGKAIELHAGDKVKFGGIDVALEFTPAEVKTSAEIGPDAPTEAFTVGEFKFSKKTEVIPPSVKTEVPPGSPETNIVDSEPDASN